MQKQAYVFFNIIRLLKRSSMILNLSKRQKEVFEYMEQFKEAHGYGPSLVDITSTLNLKSQYVHQLLQELKKRGFITYPKRDLRSVILVNEGTKPKADEVAKLLLKLSEMVEKKQLTQSEFLSLKADILSTIK